ncbi:MAG: hypothetical protein ACE5GH_05010, partial [Fidelibacterota bacterium]
MILKRLGFLAGLHLAKPVLSLLFRLNRHHIVNEGALKKALASDRPVMICCWHGRLLFPFYFLRGHGYYAVAGLHEDAEIISQL